MKTKKVITVLFVFMMMFTIAACSSSSKLVGWWDRTYLSEAANTDSFPDEMTIEKGGECRIDGFNGSWQEHDGQVSYSLDWVGNYTYNYKIKGNELYLYNVKNPDKYVIMTKQ